MRVLPSRTTKLLALLAATIVLAGIGSTTLLAEDEGAVQTVSKGDEASSQIDYSQFQVAPEKRPMNPDAGLTDEQRMQKIEDGRAMQRNFATGFLANGGDPRALQRVAIEPYSAGYASLELSVERAHRILVGKVNSVAYQAEDGIGLTYSLANVSVSKVIKGTSGQTKVTVRQTGGPMITNEGPALVQLSTGELLLPGDEVLLMLFEVEGINIALDGTGIVFFDEGFARPMAASLIKDQLAGLRQATVIDQIQGLVKP